MTCSFSRSQCSGDAGPTSVDWRGRRLSLHRILLEASPVSYHPRAEVMRPPREHRCCSRGSVVSLPSQQQQFICTFHAAGLARLISPFCQALGGSVRIRERAEPVHEIVTPFARCDHLRRQDNFDSYGGILYSQKLTTANPHPARRWRYPRPQRGRRRTLS